MPSFREIDGRLVGEELTGWAGWQDGRKSQRKRHSEKGVERLVEYERILASRTPTGVKPVWKRVADSTVARALSSQGSWLRMRGCGRCHSNPALQVGISVMPSTAS